MLRSAVLLLAAMSCGGIIGGPGIGPTPRASGGNPATTFGKPIFDFHPALMPMENALAADLTVNGITQTPAFRAYANGTGGWIVTHGGTGAMSGASSNEPSPTDDGTTAGISGGHWASTVTSEASVASEDFVVEVYFKGHAAANLTGNSNLINGWSISSDGTMTLKDGTLTKTFGFVASEGEWFHAMYFADRSGSGYAVANGVLGALGVISGMASTASVSNMRIGAVASGVGTDEPVGLVSVWRASAWLDNSATVDILSVARERFYRLAGVDMGGERTINVSAPSPSSMRRGAQMYTVGPGWPRIGEDSLGRDAYVAEKTKINIALHSNDLSNAAWLKGAATPYFVTVGGSTIDPWAETSTAAGLISSVTLPTDAHVTEQFISTTAVVHYFSAYIKAGDQYGVLLYDNTTADGVYFNATTGAKGTTLGLDVLETFTETIGGGWFRVGFAWIPTLAVNVMRIYLASADNVINFTGTGAVGAYVTGVQLEVGRRPTSPIATTTTSVTRTGCELVYVGQPLPPSEITFEASIQSMYSSSLGSNSHDFFIQLFGPVAQASMGSACRPGVLDFNYQGFSSATVQWNYDSLGACIDAVPIVVRGTASRDGASLYRDGVLLGSSAVAAAMPSGLTDIFVGSTPNTTVSTFGGYIERIRIWPRVLAP